MSLRLCALTLLLLVSGCARVRKAPAPALPATAPAPDLVARDVAKYRVMFKRGRYDEVLTDISRKIAALPADKRAQPDPRMIFVRGMARYNLGWFEEAKADLLIAQRAGVAPSTTKETLQNIEERTPLLPPNMQEIRDSGRTIFRMHSFIATRDAATIAEMLPAAYRINRQIFGKDIEATTLLFFDNKGQLSAFQRRIHKGKAISGRYSAVTTGPLVQISLRDNRPDLQEAIVHEVNHAMSNRLMGKTPLPNWFKEGLAQVAESQVDSNFDVNAQKVIARLFQNKGLLPLKKLGTRPSFDEQTELGIALRTSGNRAGAPDPYAQSYGMMKFLLDKFSTVQLQSFLQRVRASDDFDGSFAAEFGMTTEQFYEKWKAETAPKLVAR